ncbi:hypothetical protein M569_15487, partial [Genlisea aurea]
RVRLGDVWWPAMIAAVVKVLLIPAYRSTDFEVHRHWLALTHSLPLSEWYFDTTSQWTLDYPPFFAYFEKLLSFVASSVDPTMTNLRNGLDSASARTVIFQRFSVILSDSLLVYSASRISKNRNYDIYEALLIWSLIIWSPGLFIVDHLHFQYNGFLLGILLLSISFLEEGRDLMGGFMFAVLICFKHLFAVAAPLYFVYLFRHYCRGGLIKGFCKLLLMGSVVLVAFAAAYGPFVYHGQIQQVFRRMFPFGRGLCHAYWAPNFWTFYIILDKTLAFVVLKLGFDIQTPKASFTGGLVGDSSPFAVLPNVTPLITFILVLMSMSPCLVKAWRNPQRMMFAKWVSYAYTCGFLFGWHVHEKASLHFVIPLASTVLINKEGAEHYFLLSIVSCYSLFPLLFEAQEYPIKVVLLLLHAAVMYLGFSYHFSRTTRDKKLETSQFCISWIGKLYLFGLLVVEIWSQFLHQMFFGDRLPFLPLMIISLYCGLGVMYSWFWQLRQIAI